MPSPDLLPSELPSSAQILEAALRSPVFVQVRRRIFRQLLESLIYEQIVQPQIEVVSADLFRFTLIGQTGAQSVKYRALGHYQLGFKRLRLQSPIIRRFLMK